MQIKATDTTLFFHHVNSCFEDNPVTIKTVPYSTINQTTGKEAMPVEKSRIIRDLD